MIRFNDRVTRLSEKPEEQEVHVIRTSIHDGVQRETVLPITLIGAIEPIKDLLGEKAVLRALLKLLFKNEIRVISPNEFNRKVNDLAKKIDADPKCVRVILEELTRELIEEMFALPPPKMEKGSKRVPGLPLGQAFRETHEDAGEPTQP